ncbi:hypothetical protein [Leucobacter chinensis]|uniref:hypothetical protein n=1 Tax=Leucobacter chinensis TaxID=2851010 RepID=UPI001C218397|nr:hypothetical protein [Leucobacter chinensis]
MSEISRADESTQLPTERMMPRVQKMGNRDIEVTFLGLNSNGKPSWILWNPNEPHLIGLLTQGSLGYNFEQRTSVGVFMHENISLNRLNKALMA